MIFFFFEGQKKREREKGRCSNPHALEKSRKSVNFRAHYLFNQRVSACILCVGRGPPRSSDASASYPQRGIDLAESGARAGRDEGQRKGETERRRRGIEKGGRGPVCM